MKCRRRHHYSPSSRPLVHPGPANMSWGTELWVSLAFVLSLSLFLTRTHSLSLSPSRPLRTFVLVALLFSRQSLLSPPPSPCSAAGARFDPTSRSSHFHLANVLPRALDPKMRSREEGIAYARTSRIQRPLNTLVRLPFPGVYDEPHRPRHRDDEEKRSWIRETISPSPCHTYGITRFDAILYGTRVSGGQIVRDVFRVAYLSIYLTRNADGRSFHSYPLAKFPPAFYSSRVNKVAVVRAFFLPCSFHPLSSFPSVFGYETCFYIVLEDNIFDETTHQQMTIYCST